MDGASFTVNSRIISLTLDPDLLAEANGPQELQNNPIMVSLAHKQKQKDAPYRKGAVLCVHWVFE